MTAPTDLAAMAEWARGLLVGTTEGPWRAVRDVVTSDEGGCQVHAMHHAPDYRDLVGPCGPRWRADADLIAAAPDLAAAVVSLAAERDRLERVLACERGDAEAAPDGWRLTRPGRWSRPYTDDAHACVYLLDTGPNRWGWYVSSPTDRRGHSASAPTALEAMEAADAADKSREGAS